MADIQRNTVPAEKSAGDLESGSQRARRLAYEGKRIAAADASIAAGLFVSLAAIEAWVNAVGMPSEKPAPLSRR